MNSVIVKHITNKLEILFPLKLSEKWDKVGLQIGSSQKKVKNILISLDLTSYVFEKAVNKKVDLIIIHHPFLFNEEDFGDLPKEKWKSNLIQRIRDLEISIYVMHTNFDNTTNGMPLAVAKKLGINKSQIKKIKGLSFGFKFVWNNTLKNFSSFLKEKNIGTKNHHDINYNKKVGYIALFPGSASIKDVIKAHHDNQIDLVVTSDIKWSDWITFNEYKISVFEISHSIEEVFVNHIYNYLLKIVKKVNIFKNNQY